MYAKLSSLGNSFRSRASRGSRDNTGRQKSGSSASDQQRLIEKTKEIIDSSIQQRGKLHLTYHAIKKRLVYEFGPELYEKCKPAVQDLIQKAAPMPSRRSVTGARPATVASPKFTNATDAAHTRTSSATTTIFKAFTTDQSTMKHDLHGAMSRTLTEKQIEELAQALHSSWPKKASEIKKKSAAEEMDLQRGGIMSHKEGDEGMNLKLALENARKDPQVQSEMHRRKAQAFSPRHHGYTPRRRASTLATPGQDIQSTTNLLNQHRRRNFTLKMVSSGQEHAGTKRSSTAESRRRSLGQLQQSLNKQLDVTGNFVVPQSPPAGNGEMLKKRSKMSYEDSDINPRVKYSQSIGKYFLGNHTAGLTSTHLLTLEHFGVWTQAILRSIQYQNERSVCLRFHS